MHFIKNKSKFTDCSALITQNSEKYICFIIFILCKFFAGCHVCKKMQLTFIGFFLRAARIN